MEVTSKEAKVVNSSKTMKIIKVLGVVLVISTGIAVAGPEIVPFIALMCGGAVAYS